MSDAREPGPIADDLLRRALDRPLPAERAGLRDELLARFDAQFAAPRRVATGPRIWLPAALISMAAALAILAVGPRTGDRVPVSAGVELAAARIEVQRLELRLVQTRIDALLAGIPDTAARAAAVPAADADVLEGSLGALWQHAADAGIEDETERMGLLRLSMLRRCDPAVLGKDNLLARCRQLARDYSGQVTERLARQLEREWQDG